MPSQPATLGHHTALGSAVASGLACAENPPLQSISSSSCPCHAMLCHAMLRWMPLQAGRGVSQAFWQKGPDPASAGGGPNPCMGTGHAVLPRSSSAREMIDLVSASGGLSQCQASAQMAALKGESPFPLRKADQQSPHCHPRPRSHILGITGPVAAGPCLHPGEPGGEQWGACKHLGSQPCWGCV